MTDTPDFAEAFTRIPGLVAAGVGGSRSHGLDRPDSDWDLWGVWMAPTLEFLGLDTPRESNDFKLPWCDVASHELGKFVRLAAKGNPTVVERLFSDTWLPAFTTHVGRSLHECSDMFITANLLRQYSGYIGGQADVVAKVDPSEAKWWRAAKHVLRLSASAVHLCDTREVLVRLDEGTAATIRELITSDPSDVDTVRAAVAAARDRTQNRVTSALESGSWRDCDRVMVNDWLVWWRRQQVAP